jgi:hypothetical protein
MSVLLIIILFSICSRAFEAKQSNHYTGILVRWHSTKRVITKRASITLPLLQTPLVSASPSLKFCNKTYKTFLVSSLISHV